MTQKADIPTNIRIAIIDYLSGDWEECKSKELNDWLEAESNNQQTFQHLINLWGAEQISKEEKNFDHNEAWNSLSEKLVHNQSTKTFNLNYKRLLTYAAIAVFALLIGGMGYSWLQRVDFYSNQKMVEYIAPYGSRTELKLLDGSVVKLNAGTTIRYDNNFGLNNRKVELEGEAYFEVAKNEKLPFKVKTKEIAVIALGTIFNVKAYGDEDKVETTLLEGSVRVKNIEHGVKRSIVLTPSQKAVFSKQDFNFEVMQLSNLSELSWFEEEWLISNMNLQEFSRLLERRYDVEIKFQDKRIEKVVFSGKFKDETIEQIMEAVSLISPVKYKFVNKKIELNIDENRLKEFSW